MVMTMANTVAKGVANPIWNRMTSGGLLISHDTGVLRSRNPPSRSADRQPQPR